MKRLLIVTDFYSPENCIAAVRPTKISKYINQTGMYEVTVISKKLHENIKDYESEKDTTGVNVVRIGSWGFTEYIRRSVFSKKKNNNNKSIENDSKPQKGSNSKIKEYLVIFFEVLENFGLAYHANRYLKKKNVNYDYIFSTYGQFSPHLIAKRYKKDNPKAKWIADFRDSVMQEGMPEFFNSFCKIYSKMIVSSADIITAVSNGVIDTLPITKSNSFVISNGFDEEDLPSTTKAINTKLTFTYTGSVYKGKRDLSYFFKAISELSKSRKLNLNNIIIKYAGDGFNYFYDQALQFGLDGVINDCGYMSRSESLRLQFASDILLLASWNTNGATGILTGKFYEYLLMRKPIICCISGELPESTLKTYIHGGSFGVCFEEASKDDDYEMLMNYINEIYNEFINNGEIKESYNEDYVKQFDYKYIARKLLSIFESSDNNWK
ncbi:hypothetical protein ASG89_11860 [Paenibacillus sp. Soil766]|uniref:hypothetical protein n=1 Tax=Paenibacillus sp. Soil766 TaxID=1736404 RepID=UPI00070A8B38|nr:hypothetical protein [Paenibacillus sp. Soil766]KRE83808.1 hypothetical protein ASG89_11860 [Paenibacillus sp. Soil766]